jgi:hypothetical protein
MLMAEQTEQMLASWTPACIVQFDGGLTSVVLHKATNFARARVKLCEPLRPLLGLVILLSMPVGATTYLPFLFANWQPSRN